MPIIAFASMSPPSLRAAAMAASTLLVASEPSQRRTRSRAQVTWASTSSLRSPLSWEREMTWNFSGNNRSGSRVTNPKSYGKWLNNPFKPLDLCESWEFSRMHFCWGMEQGGNVIFSGKDVDGEKVTEWRWMFAEGMVPWINFTTSELHHFGFWSPDVTMITWCYNDMNSAGNLLRSNWHPLSKNNSIKENLPQVAPEILPKNFTQDTDWSTNPPPAPSSETMV